MNFYYVIILSTLFVFSLASQQQYEKFIQDWTRSWKIWRRFRPCSYSYVLTVPATEGLLISTTIKITHNQIAGADVFVWEANVENPTASAELIEETQKEAEKNDAQTSLTIDKVYRRCWNLVTRKDPLKIDILFQVDQRGILSWCGYTDLECVPKYTGGCDRGFYASDFTIYKK